MTFDAVSLVSKQREFFKKGKTLSRQCRISQLHKLKKALINQERNILDALHKDLGKPEMEAWSAELGYVLNDIDYALGNLGRWMKPKRVRTPFLLFPATSFHYPEPYGVVFIIAPWNYPLQLLLSPLVGALAAGNTAIVKPSTTAPHTANILVRIIQKTFDEQYVAVVKGSAEEAKKMLEQKLDYIFFTGGSEVGKLVMEAAAKNLTPLTLELGGKNPCLVDDTAHIPLTARRLAWGKFYNSGQTCIAPNYVAVHHKVKDQLVMELKKNLEKFYGEPPQKSRDYGRIVNQRHFLRLQKLLEGKKPILGGETKKEEQFIAPTILDASWDDEFLEEEIFGPILPIISYDNLEDVLEHMKKNPKPLSCYIFSTNKKFQESILKNVSSGGVCINDTLLQVANPNLPFGGVGGSGMGKYHGKASFDTFTHYKSVLKKSNFFDLKIRYPPYKDTSLMRKLLKWFG